MSTTKTFSSWLGFAALTTGLLAGCDLIEFAQNPSVTLTLPTRSYSFSTEDKNWKAPPPAFNQPIPCNAPSDCCVMVPGLAINCADYQLLCEQNVCAMRVKLEVPQTIDLQKDAPEFADIGGRVVKEMLLRELRYTADNKIGADLPPIDVYVAPEDVKTSSDKEKAKLLVSLPKTVAGVKAEETVMLSAEAQKAFSDRALDVKNPFNLIAGTDVIVKSGTPIPMGKVDVTVTGRVTVKF
jgi:hypothetical protein